MWICAHCNKNVNKPSKICPHCNLETEIPSHIVLAGEDEINLSHRFQICKKSMKNSKDLKRLNYYKRRLQKSISISINVHPETLVNLLQDERIKYTNLHENLRANAITKYDSELAAKRRGIDNLVFGADGEKLNYGAVNLGTLGLYSYGACCIFLKDREIKNRVSFLEENSFNYLTQSGPTIQLNIPQGSRALWPKAHVLSTVKHCKDLLKNKRWSNSELKKLILFSNGEKKTDRFIEAQIYPPISLGCFKKIMYNPNYSRQIKDKKIVGKTAVISRKILAEYFKSLDLHGIELEVEEKPI